MKRVASIDIFRALTMLLMLWVNDYAWMEGIPHWMLHAPTREDMLGLADMAFPSFLFCMGMSVPLAAESRLKRGEGLPKTFLHIILRCISLLIMGVFELNTSGYVQQILMVTGYFLVWNNYPVFSGKKRFIPVALRAAGIALLVGVAASQWPMRTGWWGILGLIGWAYLFCSTIYLALRKVKAALPFAWIAIVAMMLLSQSRLHIGAWLPGGWSHTALAFSGLICTCIALRCKERNKPAAFPLWAVVFAALCFGGFAACHNWWHISKNLATPTWVFLCLAIDLCVFALIYFTADIRGRTGWARPIQAGGVATLTCYQIPYLWYPLSAIIGLGRPGCLNSGIPGLIVALVFSLAVIVAAELLGKIHIRLKI